MRVRDLEGGLRKTMLVAENWTLRELLAFIAHRFGVPHFSEYGLQIESTAARPPTESGWLSDRDCWFTGVRLDDTLIFRKRYFVSDQFASTKNAAALHFMYLEARQRVLTGAYPTSLDKAVELAALQMQITYRNYDPLVHVAGFLDLSEFLPAAWRSSEHPYIEEDVYAEHRKLKGLSDVDAKYRYLQHCLAFPSYGMCLFPAKERSLRSMAFERDVLVGITYEAIVRLDPHTMELQSKHALCALRDLQCPALGRVVAGSGSISLFSEARGPLESPANSSRSALSQDPDLALHSGSIDLSGSKRELSWRLNGAKARRQRVLMGSEAAACELFDYVCGYLAIAYSAEPLDDQSDPRLSQDWRASISLSAPPPSAIRPLPPSAAFS